MAIADVTGTFITISNSVVTVSASTPAEAKLAIKELKLRRRELGLAKREVAAQLKAIRVSYADSVKRRIPVPGGGSIGRIVRAAQTVSRALARNELAEHLAPLEQEKQSIEAVQHAIDEAILRVDQYISIEAQRGGEIDTRR